MRGAGQAELVDDFIADSREAPGTLTDARELLGETWDNLEQIDAMLARHARHWQLSRLALVDRNILRIGVWELLSGRAPFKVVISEALRLAKEFSSAESSRFVNGVLDAVAHEIRRDIEGNAASGEA